MSRNAKGHIRAKKGTVPFRKRLKQILVQRATAHCLMTAGDLFRQVSVYLKPV